jgi:hypothetical protein
MHGDPAADDTPSDARAALRLLRTHTVPAEQKAKLAPRRAGGDRYVFLNTHRDHLNERLVWTRYTVNETIYHVIREHLTSLDRPLTVRTKLLDRAGRVVSADEYARVSRKRDKDKQAWSAGALEPESGALVIGPYFFGTGDSMAYFQELEVQAKLPITLAEIKDVNSISQELAFEE